MRPLSCGRSLAAAGGAAKTFGVRFAEPGSYLRYSHRSPNAGLADRLDAPRFVVVRLEMRQSAHSVHLSCTSVRRFYAFSLFSHFVESIPTRGSTPTPGTIVE